MAHQFNNLRAHKVEHSRVGTITKACGGGTAGGATAPSGMMVGRKDGGAVVARATGGPVQQRSDRPARAFGGRLGGKKKKSGKSGNHVNITIAPHPKPALPMMPPPGVASAPPPMPPKPPMMPPPAGPGPIGAPPGVGAGPMPPPGALPPPGMPPRYAGGRAYKKGGAVFSGAQMKVSKTASGTRGANKTDANSAGIGKGRTPVQPSPNKQDGKNIGRGPVVTKAAGGPISAPREAHAGMGPKPPGGGGGGKERKWAAARAISSGYGGATRTATNPTRDP